MKNIPKLIGIAGAKQAGKTTLADYLYKILNSTNYPMYPNVHILPIADYLKTIVRICFDATEEQVNGTDEQKESLLSCGLTCRHLMQQLGTEIFRSLDPDCWLRAWQHGLQLMFYNKKMQHILIPDVRFENEVNYIHSHEGMMIWLRRFTILDSHVSEQSVQLRIDCYCEDRDLIIDNSAMTVKECHKRIHYDLLAKYVNTVKFVDEQAKLEDFENFNCTIGIDRRGEKGVGM